MRFQHQVPLLRLGEFDLGGVLYHANYFHLFESARESLLSSEGIPYSALVSDGCHLVIAESNQRFLAPIRYGEPLLVEVSFREAGAASVVVDYRITALADATKPLHEAWTKLVFVKNSQGAFKAGRFPEKLLQIFEKFGAKT